MAKDFHKLDRIPAEQLTAYERWELPVMDASGNELVAPAPEMVEEEIEIQPLTAQELEAIRQAAWQEGQQEGFHTGREEGFREGREAGYSEGLVEGRVAGEQQGAESKRGEIDAALQRLESIVAELMEPIRRQQDEVEQALLHLALAVSRSVIRREVSLDSQQVRLVVREALDALPRGSDQIRLQVNPQDAPYLREMAAQQQEPWVIVDAPDVLPGGCKVETRYSLLDYTVEKRFQLAVRQMLDRRTAVQPAEKVADLTEAMGDLTDFQRELMDSPRAAPEPGPEPAAETEAVKSPAQEPTPSESDNPVHESTPSELPRDPDDPR